MNGSKKVILHIICDSIWYEKMYPIFEQMDNYENLYLFRSAGVNKNYVKEIKDTSNVIFAQNIQEWGRIINDPKNDIIHFQGLWKDSAKAVDYIRKEAVVAWWVFGMDIYHNVFGWAPLMRINIYKPRTFFFILRHSKTVKSYVSTVLTYKLPSIYDFLQRMRYFVQRKKRIYHKEILSRIDYAYTPLPIELDMLKKIHPYIKAISFNYGGATVKMPYEYKEKVGYILFDHSAISNNNHLDIIPHLKKTNIEDREVFIPLSYGDELVRDYMFKHAFFKGAKTHFLTEMLERQEYNELLSNCSHALFGTIRQSGVGNVNILLRKGVKIFFFENSIMYKHFKREGYYVFSIEKDLNDESIKTPLTEEMALHNYNLFYEHHPLSNKTYKDSFDSMLEQKHNNEFANER